MKVAALSLEAMGNDSAPVKVSAGETGGAAVGDDGAVIFNQDSALEMSGLVSHSVFCHILLVSNRRLRQSETFWMTKNLIVQARSWRSVQGCWVKLPQLQAVM